VTVEADTTWAQLPADQRVLRATIQQLAQLDPAALAIQQICRLADVTPPTIYYHFGSKDGLIAAAVEQLVEDWLAMMDAAVSRGGTMDDTLERVIDAWQATITSPTRPISVFAWVTLLAADSSPQCRDALIRARVRSRSMIAEALAPHVPATLVDDLAGVVMDTVLASAVHYELDHDVAQLRTRLDSLGRALMLATTVGARAANPA
jgi:AcrR family transcriptional regulator